MGADTRSSAGALRNLAGAWLRRRGIAALCVLAALVTAPCSLAQSPQVHDEARVKAAYLLRFVQYVEWPQDLQQPAKSPVRIGIIGASEIAEESLQASAVRGAQGRAVAVYPLKGGENLAQFHVVFIGDDERANLPQYLGALRGKPTLVVTESPGALQQGSTINFVIVEQHVKFEIAIDAAERSGITLSSRLLAVALRVHKGALAAANTLASCCTHLWQVR